MRLTAPKCYFYLFTTIILSWSLTIEIVGSSTCPEICSCRMDERGRRKVLCERGNMKNPINILDMPENTQILIITAPHHKQNSLSLGPIFKSLRRLEEIHIKWSAVPNIGAHSFWRLKHLKILNLTHNCFSNIMETNFKGIISLEKLDLSYNIIESIPSAVFRYVPNLSSLDLSHNRMNSLVTRVFFGLSKLEYLDLSHNPIKKLSSEVLSDVPYLKKFSCESCELIELNRKTLSILRSVIVLNLNNNNFSTIPDMLDTLQNLTSLHLNGNKIHTIKTETFLKSSVFEVFLSHNDISNVERRAFANSSIIRLDLSYNKLSDVSRGGFTDVISNLRDLRLSGNPIHNEKLFGLLEKGEILHDLAIGDIGLVQIPNTIVTGTSLRNLNISANYLTYLSTKLLASNPNLRVLDISSNNFEGMDKSFLEAVNAHKNLQVLRLEGNPFRCDSCHVSDLQNWLQRSPDQESGCPEPKVWTCLRCIGPEQIKNQPLALLPPGDLPKCIQNPETGAVQKSTLYNSSSHDIHTGNELSINNNVDVDELSDELKQGPPHKNGASSSNRSNNLSPETCIYFITILFTIIHISRFHTDS